MAKYQLQQKLANGTMKDIPITSVNDVADINVIPDDYTEVDLINKNGSTLAAIPFRKINGESIIGKDPLTISGGGGTSHPVYTELNTNKYQLTQGTYNGFNIKFTGESGSRYIFKLDDQLLQTLGQTSGIQSDKISLEIQNDDVEVTFYNTVSTSYWSGTFDDPTAFLIYNTGLIFLTKSEEFNIANAQLDINGCDCGPEYINNGGCSFDIGFPTSTEQKYSNELYFTLKKDEVGTLHVTVGLVYTL